MAVTQEFHFSSSGNPFLAKRCLTAAYNLFSNTYLGFLFIFLLLLFPLQLYDYPKLLNVIGGEPTLEVKSHNLKRGVIPRAKEEEKYDDKRIVVEEPTEILEDPNGQQFSTNFPKTTREKRPGEIEKCPPIYGRVMIFVLYNTDAVNRGMYRVANASLRCYLKSQNYNLVYVDVTKDERSLKACGQYKTAYWFRKHCVVAEYLKDTDWMMVLDADTGIVNPHHCIEEYIDPRVDFVFYERNMHWEIACGNYLVKNTPFAIKFLMDWADWEFKLPKSWTGVDNGVMQHHILKNAIPDAVQEYENCMTTWKRSTNYDTYMRFISCIKQTLGANRVWPGKFRIYRKSHSWVRDAYITNDDWTDSDFMIHGWKGGDVSKRPELSPAVITNYPAFFEKMNKKSKSPPFTTIPDYEKCDSTENGWPWIPEKKKSQLEIRKYFAEFEEYAANKIQYRIVQHLELPDIALCYPHCENGTDLGKADGG